MSKPGRNQPCPCGSGRKYKHCCIDKAPPFASGLDEALESAQGGQGFEDIAQVEAFISGWQAMQNTRPLDDFQGLSPEQMGELLDHPFEAPGLLRWHFDQGDPSGAPVMEWFLRLADGIGDKGLKPTATGNLPRNLCREIAWDYWGEERYREETAIGGINTEPDVAELHKTRVVAELAGLMRRYRGRFILSRQARDWIADGDTRSLYRALFRAYCETFNWAYEDLQADFHIIQQAFAFSLYLLHRYGDKSRPTDFYAESFVRAFPAILDEAEDSRWHSAEWMVNQSYTLRTWQRGFAFLGLAECRETGRDSHGLPSFTVRRAPLMEHTVLFWV